MPKITTLKGAKKLTLDALEKKAGLKGANDKMFRKMRLKSKKTYRFCSNVSGSAGRRCPCGCGSWVNHWEKGTKKKFGVQKCAVWGCSAKAVLGAHVFLEKKGVKQFIIPFCSAHNQKSVTLALALKSAFRLTDAIPAYDQLP